MVCIAESHAQDCGILASAIRARPPKAAHRSIRPRSLAAAQVCGELDEQVRLVYSDGDVQTPTRPFNLQYLRGVLDAHLAIARAPSETSGANCASRDNQRQPPRAFVRSGHVASSST
jgi:hypothetical protein